MMLLTAFVLVLGFVALTGMVARVTQLPEATAAAADRPIYIEAAAVARGVEQVMHDTNALIPVRANGTNMPAYTQAVSDALRHMIILESARGYRLQLDPLNLPGCDDTSGQAIMHASFSLADTETIISFTIRYAVYDAWSQTLPGNEANPNAWGDGYLEPAAGQFYPQDTPVAQCAP